MNRKAAPHKWERQHKFSVFYILDRDMYFSVSKQYDTLHKAKNIN